MKKSSIVIVTFFAISTGFFASWYLYGNKTIELEDARWFGEQARALPEFELIDQNSKTITRASLEGKWSLMFFGYTYCPDICPTTLQTMSEMLGIRIISLE